MSKEIPLSRLAPMLEEVDLATTGFLKELSARCASTLKMPYPALAFALQAFGDFPIGYSDERAAELVRDELQPDSIRGSSDQDLVQLLRDDKGSQISNALNAVFEAAEQKPTYCAASYWSPDGTRHTLSRRARPEESDRVPVLRAAYAFFLWSLLQKKEYPALIQYIGSLDSPRKVGVNLCYDGRADGNNDDGWVFSITLEEREMIGALARICEVPGTMKALPSDEGSVRESLGNLMFNQGLVVAPAHQDKEGLDHHLESLRNINFGAPALADLLARFRSHLVKRLGASRDATPLQLFSILATSVLYNTMVCPAKYLHPIIVPVGGGASVFTFGTDTRVEPSVLVAIRSFARALYTGPLLIDRARFHLDRYLKRKSVEIIRTLRHEAGNTFLFLGNKRVMEKRYRVPSDCADQITTWVRYCRMLIDLNVEQFEAFAGVTKKQPEQGDIRQVVQEWTSFFSRDIDEQHPAAAIRTRLGQRPVSTPDVRWWRLLLSVLIHNAIKYGVGGEVDISIQQEAEKCVLLITNCVPNDARKDLGATILAVLTSAEPVTEDGFIGLMAARAAVKELGLGGSIETDQTADSFTVRIVLSSSEGS